VENNTLTISCTDPMEPFTIEIREAGELITTVNNNCQIFNKP